MQKIKENCAKPAIQSCVAMITPSRISLLKDDINPDSWKRYGDNYPSKAERDRAMKRLLTDDKIVED